MVQGIECKNCMPYLTGSNLVLTLVSFVRVTKVSWKESLPATCTGPIHAGYDTPEQRMFDQRNSVYCDRPGNKKSKVKTVKMIELYCNIHTCLTFKSASQIIGTVISTVSPLLFLFTKLQSNKWELVDRLVLYTLEVMWWFRGKTLQVALHRNKGILVPNCSCHSWSLSTFWKMWHDLSLDQRAVLLGFNFSPEKYCVGYKRNVAFLFVFGEIWNRSAF